MRHCIYLDSEGNEGGSDSDGSEGDEDGSNSDGSEGNEDGSDSDGSEEDDEEKFHRLPDELEVMFMYA